MKEHPKGTKSMEVQTKVHAVERFQKRRLSLIMPHFLNKGADREISFAGCSETSMAIMEQKRDTRLSCRSDCMLRMRQQTL